MQKALVLSFALLTREALTPSGNAAAAPADEVTATPQAANTSRATLAPNGQVDAEGQDLGSPRASTLPGASGVNSRPARPAPPWLVALHIGIGKEWLKGSGGASDYAGNANIGGTSLHVEAANGASPQAPWYTDLAAAAHDYNTITQVESTSGAATSESESKLLRMTARAGEFFTFHGSRSDRSFAAIGLGLGYLRMPVLTVAASRQASGETQLSDQSMLGPFVGFSYQARLSKASDVGLMATVVPSTFAGPAKGQESDLYTYWRFAFAPFMFSEIGVLMGRTKVHTTVPCPAVDYCLSSSSAAADLLQSRMGIGGMW